MQAQDFAKFVASQQEPTQDAASDIKIDWRKVREEWLNDLDDLYRRIDGFLKEFIEKGSITYNFTEIKLNEENLGSYAAKRMEISIGRQHVSLVISAFPFTF